jgi:hypothetical protein
MTCMFFILSLNLLELVEVHRDDDCNFQLKIRRIKCLLLRQRVSADPRRASLSSDQLKVCSRVSKIADGLPFMNISSLMKQS